MGIGGSKNKTISPTIIHSKNNGVTKPEYMFPGTGRHIPDEKLKTISNQKEKSICKITINKGPEGIGFGTGFLCIIGEYKKIKCLVTAYHVLVKNN